MSDDLLAKFPVILEWPVQWGDQDALGHVNNTVYFRWCESARVAYMQRLGLEAWMKPNTNPNGIGPILAKIDCNYKRQLHFPDTVRIGARVSQLGRTSLTMEHTIVSARQNEIVAESTSVIVVFNYQTQRPTPIPADVRQAIESLEQTRQ
jgi:acyl-CoA thioester hydrolase